MKDSKENKEKKIKKSFAEKWEEKDIVCEKCGQITKINRGLTKQNIKKLFRKPDQRDIIIFILLALLLVTGFAYQKELDFHNNIIIHLGEICPIYLQSLVNGNFGNYSQSELGFNLTIINPDEVK